MFSWWGSRDTDADASGPDYLFSAGSTSEIDEILHAIDDEAFHEYRAWPYHEVLKNVSRQYAAMSHPDKDALLISIAKIRVLYQLSQCCCVVLKEGAVVKAREEHAGEGEEAAVDKVKAMWAFEKISKSAAENGKRRAVPMKESVSRFLLSGDGEDYEKLNVVCYFNMVFSRTNEVKGRSINWTDLLRTASLEEYLVKAPEGGDEKDAEMGAAAASATVSVRPRAGSDSAVRELEDMTYAESLSFLIHSRGDGSAGVLSAMDTPERPPPAPRSPAGIRTDPRTGRHANVVRSPRPGGRLGAEDPSPGSPGSRLSTGSDEVSSPPLRVRSQMVLSDRQLAELREDVAAEGDTTGTPPGSASDAEGDVGSEGSSVGSHGSMTTQARGRTGRDPAPGAAVVSDHSGASGVSSIAAGADPNPGRHRVITTARTAGERAAASDSSPDDGTVKKAGEGAAAASGGYSPATTPVKTAAERAAAAPDPDQNRGIFSGCNLL